MCVCAASQTLQYTAVRCNILPHTATYCNTLQHTATHLIKRLSTFFNLPVCVCVLRVRRYNTLQCAATYCHTLQNTTTHCNILQHTARHLTKRLINPSLCFIVYAFMSSLSFYTHSDLLHMGIEVLWGLAHALQGG